MLSLIEGIAQLFLIIQEMVLANRIAAIHGSSEGQVALQASIGKEIL